jgi:hypothetical protein
MVGDIIADSRATSLGFRTKDRGDCGEAAAAGRATVMALV